MNLQQRISSVEQGLTELENIEDVLELKDSVKKILKEHDLVSLIKDHKGLLSKVLSLFNYDNPIKIYSRDTFGASTTNIGGTVSKMLGITSTRSPGLIQKAVFEQLYNNDFKEYLDSCYDGKIKDLVSDFLVLDKSRKSCLLDSLLVLQGLGDFKKEFLSEFGYDDPINIFSQNASGKGTQNIGYFVSKFLGIKSTLSPNPIRKAVFEQLYDNNFHKYLDSCYAGDFNRFFSKMVGLDCTRRGSFLRAIASLEDYDLYKKDFIKEMGFVNPISISEDSKPTADSENLISFFAKYLDLKTRKSPQLIQAAIFKELYDNNFQSYLDSQYKGDINLFKKDFGKLKLAAVSTCWDVLVTLDNFSQYETNFSDLSCYYKDPSHIKEVLGSIIDDLGFFPSAKYIKQEHGALFKGIDNYHCSLSKVKIKLGFFDQELDILKQVVGEVYDGS